MKLILTWGSTKRDLQENYRELIQKDTNKVTQIANQEIG